LEDERRATISEGRGGWISPVKPICGELGAALDEVEDEDEEGEEDEEEREDERQRVIASTATNRERPSELPALDDDEDMVPLLPPRHSKI